MTTIHAGEFAAARAAKPSRARYGILTLIALGTMISYLDRTILGIAAPSLTADLGISSGMMGFVLSAFSWTYCAAQIPGGIFLDRFGSKITYCAAVGFWSLFTLFQGFAPGLYSMILCRFGLGVSEAPCFPTNSRVVAIWFPQSERATATAVYTVGEYMGLALFSPVLYWLMAVATWHALFLAVGAIGLGFALLWWLCYREPQDSRWANQAELDYIAAGGGLTPPASKNTPFAWADIRSLLSYRQIWGAAIGQFAGNAMLVFFLTWFPSYLATERHMTFLHVGFLAVLPFVAGGIGVMTGGGLSDWLLKTTGSVNFARKLPIIGGLLLASTIILANYVTSDLAVIIVMSIAFFGQGNVGLGWTLISDIAPKRLVGLTGGLFNFAANLAGILTPLIIGVIVDQTGSFVDALIFISGIAVVGALSYIFLLGDVKRIELDPIA